MPTLGILPQDSRACAAAAWLPSTAVTQPTSDSAHVWTEPGVLSGVARSRRQPPRTLEVIDEVSDVAQLEGPSAEAERPSVEAERPSAEAERPSAEAERQCGKAVAKGLVLASSLMNEARVDISDDHATVARHLQTHIAQPAGSSVALRIVTYSPHNKSRQMP